MIFYHKLDDDYLVLSDNPGGFKRITIPRGPRDVGDVGGEGYFSDGKRYGDICIHVRRLPPGGDAAAIVAGAVSEALERCSGTLYVVNRCPAVAQEIESLLRDRSARYEMFLARHHLGVMLPASNSGALFFYYRSLYSGSATRKLIVRTLAGLRLQAALRWIMNPAVQVFVIQGGGLSPWTL